MKYKDWTERGNQSEEILACYKMQKDKEVKYFDKPDPKFQQSLPSDVLDPQ